MSGAGDDFWRFSLALYRREGVPETCVALQDDHGVDVNVLFYCLFRAERGHALSPGDVARLDETMSPWRDMVVRPLRQVRRALKTPGIAALAADDDALRQRVKAVELEAEKRQQMALALIGAGIRGREAEPAEAARISWHSYGSHLGGDLPEAALDRLVGSRAG